ncbi:MAG TPA: ABC transporter permease [Gemmataceae bacterium]|nr:ABC transporter permease [Gemmataceae bacterium]
MKFLAILKDSLRETLDVKLFYVLGALSVLLILFVASITYKPEPMEPRIKSFAVMVPLAIGITQDLQAKDETRGLIVQPDVKNFEQLDKDKGPWEAPFRFTLLLTLLATRDEDRGHPFGKKGGGEGPEHVETDKDRELIAEGKKRLTPDYVQRMVKQGIPFVKDVEVKPAEGEHDQAAFTVTTNGTTFKSRKEWFHTPALFFGALEVPMPVPMPLGIIIQFIGDWIVGTFGTAIIMFLSVIMTASFLPSMLNKGTVDLLLVKPIHRTSLFLYKFTGGLLFMFLNTALIMGGIWLALGLQTGIWTNSFLLCIFIYTFQFAVFYSVSALAAVFTRSPIVAILASVALWVLLFAVGWTHWWFIEKGREQKPPSETQHWAYVGYDAVHTVLPHYKDVDWLTTRLIVEELVSKIQADPADREKTNKQLDKDYGAYHWRTSLLVSGLFIVVVVGLACWRFTVRDY